MYTYVLIFYPKLEDKLSPEIKEQEEAVVQKMASQKNVTSGNLEDSRHDGGKFISTDCCLDKLSKSRSHAARMVTLSGFCSNIIVKGIMKAVGFIFKAIMDHIPGLPPILGVLFPATLHLFFNCFCKPKPILYF